MLPDSDEFVRGRRYQSDIREMARFDHRQYENVLKVFADAHQMPAAEMDKDVQAEREAIALQTGDLDYFSTDWPKLVPLDHHKLPELPAEYLPSWAGDYARALSNATETPIELPAGMVLATCSAAAARVADVEVYDGYREVLNNCFIVTGDPRMRKSAVHKAAVAPLFSWEREQAEALAPEIIRCESERASLEARAKEFRKRSATSKDSNEAKHLAAEAAEIEAELPEVPTPPQLWTSDATPEKMGVLLADNDECMAWLSAEGGLFEMLGGRYSSNIPNLDLFLKSHVGDPERVDRGSRKPVYLEKPRVTIGNCVQPDVLCGLAAKPGFRGRGLLARFNLLMPLSNLGYRTMRTTPVPESVEAAYHAGIRAMLDLQGEPLHAGGLNTLTLTPDALNLWSDYWQAMEVQMRPGEKMENITDWGGKASGSAARIAGVFHVIEHAHGRPWEIPITGDTMNAALEISYVFAEHSRAALDLMGSEPTINAARQVWEWIRRNHAANSPEREIFRAKQSTFQTMKSLRTAINVLEERGYVIVVKRETSGPGRKPSPRIVVRPELTRGW